MRFVPALLLASLVALTACSDFATGDEDGLASSAAGAGGQGAAAGSFQGKAGSGGASSGSAGSLGVGGDAGEGQGGTAGSGTDKATDGFSAACRACVRALCVDCPEGKPDCEPCSEPGRCDGARACICEAGCKDECGAGPYCGPPPQGGGGTAGAGEYPQGGAGGSGNTFGAGGAAGLDAGAGGSASGCPGCGGQGGTNSPVAEQCANGVDDNENGEIDCDEAPCAAACGDPCAAPAVIALAEGASKASTKGMWKGHADAFTPSCATQAQTGPDLAYLLRNDHAKKGYFTVRLSAEVDTTLSLRKQCGGLDPDVICRNQVGEGGAEELTVAVDPGGQWIVLAGAAQPEPGGGFELQVDFTEATCGDGKVTPDEECDGSPGCDSKCHVIACASASTIADGLSGVTNGDAGGGTSALQPSCSKLGSTTPEHVYSVRAAQTGRMLLALRSMQDDDLTLSVRASCQATGAELACVDSSPGADKALERLSVPVVEGQVLYAVVDTYEAEQKGAFELFARSYPLACGDQIVAPTEHCDGSADCEADCTRTLPAGSPLESEPNNIAALASAGPAGSAAVLGRIWPAGDVDWYRVQVDKEGTLKASVEEPSGSCAVDTLDAAGLEGRLDSELALLRLDGTLLASNDNAPGLGFCSKLAAKVEPGAYLLRVRASAVASPEQVFSYRLSVDSP